MRAACAAARHSAPVSRSACAGRALDDVAAAGDQVECTAWAGSGDLLLGDRSGAVGALLLHEIVVADGDGERALIVDDDRPAAVMAMTGRQTKAAAAVVGRRRGLAAG